MGMFWKRRPRRPARAAAAWSRLGQWINRKQLRIAAHLQVRLHKLPVLAQTGILMGICVVFAVASIYFFYRGANGDFRNNQMEKLSPKAVIKIDSLIK